MADRLVSWALWPVDRAPSGRPGGGIVPGATWRMNPDDAFVWKHGRADVTLTQEGDHWRVSYAAVGRLMGPRRTLYEARYRRSDLAVWDVMARVTRVCRDEEIAVRAGYDAAHWVNARKKPVDA